MILHRSLVCRSTWWYRYSFEPPAHLSCKLDVLAPRGVYLPPLTWPTPLNPFAGPPAHLNAVFELTIPLSPLMRVTECGAMGGRRRRRLGGHKAEQVIREFKKALVNGNYSREFSYLLAVFREPRWPSARQPCIPAKAAFEPFREFRSLISR
jgi:hypothetical protein